MKSFYYSTAPFSRSNHLHWKILFLNGYKIGFAGPAGEIAAICPNVEELDLARNEFTNWHEVGWQIDSCVQWNLYKQAIVVLYWWPGEKSGGGGGGG